MSDSKNTPIHRFLQERGGKFVDFAGYQLPMQFAGKGFMKEHLHCRSKAALFDVSHMGQFKVRDPQGRLAGAFPVDPASLAAGSGRYTQLLREDGGTIDDLILASDGDFYFIVFNGSRKDVAIEALTERSPGIEVETSDNALIALQGPSAGAVLAPVFPEAAGLGFMQARWLSADGHECRVSRSGYTGEDGFEISAPPGYAEELCGRLAEHPDFDLAGLGARDSLRLEAGLCLYGNELDEQTTPVEAGLVWSIPKARREKGAFVGSDRVVEQIEGGVGKKLVGLDVLGKTPVRQGCAVLDAQGEKVGEAVSGVFSPSLGKPISTAYVTPANAAPGTPVQAEVRGKAVECKVAKLPFTPHNYKK